MATDPLALEAEVKAYQAKLTTRQQTATARIRRIHGADLRRRPRSEPYKRVRAGGRTPITPRALRHLRRLEQQHGQIVEILITEARALARAPGVRRPGNYFARAVCLKLRENGLA